MPPIPGLDSFEGPAFHTAQWRHDVDLTGKRVAVVGTGCSAIQVVPAIQPIVERVDVYQRSPGWTFPKMDFAYTERTKRLFERFPVLQRLDRAAIFAFMELGAAGMTRHRWLLAPFRAAGRRQINKAIQDPELRRKVTPTDEIGCKRLMLTDDWYPTLTKPNVELVTDRIAEVTPAGIRTGDGAERPADVLVLATGFKTHGFVAPMEIAGAEGRTLAEEWAGVPRAYLGMSVPGFPNMFLLYGPNTNGGTGSVIYTIEAGMGARDRGAARARARRRAPDRGPAPRRPRSSTASCAPLWPGPSGTPAARTGTWTRTATTRTNGRGCGAPTGAARSGSTAAPTSWPSRPMSFQDIRYEVADHVLTITLNRPDRLNAFTPTMGRELIEAFDQADADDDVRAIIVTGEGRGFCAGADLAGGGETFDWRDRQEADEIPRDGGGRVTLRIYESTKPVIAAINGPAVGVGITMTLPMDIRLAAEGAKIGFVFTRRGIVPEACSSWFLPRIVGISQAMEWVATGRVFSAEEALAGGLVRSVHPEGELLGAAQALAREIADNAAPVSVALARRLLWTMLGAEPPDGGAPRRLAGDVRARAVRRRARGRHVVPREARRAVHRQGQRGAPRDIPRPGRARVLVAGYRCRGTAVAAAAAPHAVAVHRGSLAVHAQGHDRPGAYQRRMSGEPDAAVEAAPRPHAFAARAQATFALPDVDPQHTRPRRPRAHAQEPAVAPEAQPGQQSPPACCSKRSARSRSRHRRGHAPGTRSRSRVPST